MNSVHKKGLKVSRKLDEAFSSMGRKLTMGLTVPLGLAGGAMIKMASDAEETSAKFNTVFRDISGRAQASADVLTKSFGLSQKAAQELLGDTGDLLTGFGFTQESALDLSEDVNKLAVDLASFTNFSGGAEGASKALTKALLGERESVKSLGISILEADVNAKILENTQKGLTFETNRQAKAYATLQLAQEQSKNAIGDFARTQDSFANQMRQLKAEVSDLAVEFGKELLPIAKAVLGVARDMISEFSGMSDRSKRLGLAIAGLATAIGPTLWALGTMSKAVSKLLVLMPKLTAVMIANPYIAVGAAIAAVGTAAWMSSKRMKELREESKRMLEMDLDALSVKMLDEQINALANKIEGIDSSSFTLFGYDFEAKRLQELHLELGELVSKRNALKASSKGDDKIISDNATESVTQSTEAVKELSREIEQVKVAISKPVDKIFDPTDVVASQMLNTEMQKFNMALIESATYTADFSHRLDDVTTKAETSSGMMEGFATSIGNMFSQAVLHGSKLQDVLKNLIKQLASRAIVTGLGALLTGGASLAGGSFLGALFGGFRAGGGPVSSGMSYVVGEQGPELFTPSRSGSIIPNSGSVGGQSIDPRAIGHAVGVELDKRIHAMNPETIYALAQKGKYSY